MQFDNLDDPGLLGRAMFTMAAVLLALLEFLAAGSKFLIGTLHGTVQDWELSTLFLTLLGGCYLTLAHGVWHRRPWSGLLAALLTVLLTLFSVFRFVNDEVFDLALALVYFLALTTNVGLLLWLALPANRQAMEAIADTGTTEGWEGRQVTPERDGREP